VDSDGQSGVKGGICIPTNSDKLTSKIGSPRNVFAIKKPVSSPTWPRVMVNCWSVPSRKIKITNIIRSGTVGRVIV
jgi:hypothetical protein